MTNPLCEPSTLDYGLPPFDTIRLEHVEPAIDAGVAQQRAEIAAICAETEPSWANTVEALEISGAILRRATAWFFNLQGTDATEAFDDVAARIIPVLSAHEDWLYQHDELYRRVRGVDVPEDEQSRRLHRLLCHRFVRRGADLNAEGRARLNEINERLAVLSEQFGRNLLADTQALAVAVDTAEELDGLSEARIAAARQLAEDSGREGYLLALELPSTQSAQEVLTNPATRHQVFEASRRRGAHSNRDVLLETVRLRAERARLLGYDTHADVVIEQETAGSADAARRLLTDIAPAASANAAAELKLASELAEQELDAADWPYYAAQLRQRDQGVTDEQLRPYFHLSRVLRDGVFYAAHLLYGITVIDRPDLKAYRDDVKVYEVLDHDGEGLGLLLTDYRARASKRGGAWMSTFTEQAELTGSRPVVVNVMSVSDNALTMDEVTTVFHEFGHALHGLLSDVRYPSLSGTNVPRDWVEFPSQINENWAFVPEIVAHYARHEETGEPLPESYLKAVYAQRQAGQGFATAEYLGAAIIDLAWHSLNSEQAAAIEDIEAFEQAALADAGLDVEALVPRYTSAYFNHIFAGGYSAGYYSYLWAEALDADGFSWFEQQSDLRAAGQRFRDLVLSRGAARDYPTAFEELVGRPRSVKALLARRGLAGSAVDN
ncbi:M3 family metallopeptidase [Corynebacterium uterequi]|uniref:Peptidyl-dipeptidase Dcp n=1 Tax=Corynebacterium uterequi TaxID=1072256 RepID=A0A0G3HKB7_9CORY|nr:M3 family metallopeptidase [Corynebacterium uterequi]AKK11592.1 peptidyl-dipeptidase Dcp [Corynebacterium uterequi]